MIEFKHSEQAPPAFGLGGVAKIVGVAAFVAVAAAHALATATDQGLLPHVSVVWPQTAARTKTATQVSTIIHSIGVDGMPTATITTTKPKSIEAQALSPCGEADASRKEN
ncbi:MAG TPA: hypothetical protein VED87_12020 [Methylocystis sp.]|nr:hypothetical protein [Methylocystis sp.]